MTRVRRHLIKRYQNESIYETENIELLIVVGKAALDTQTSTMIPGDLWQNHLFAAERQV